MRTVLLLSFIVCSCAAPQEPVHTKMPPLSDEEKREAERPEEVRLKVLGTLSSGEGEQGDHIAAFGASEPAVGVAGSGSLAGRSPRARTGAVGRARLTDLAADRVDSSTAKSILRRNLFAFRGCYHRGLIAAPASRGRAMFQVELDKGGAVTASSLLQSDAALDTRTTQCVLKRLKRLRVPRVDPGGASLKFGLAFELD